MFDAFSLPFMQRGALEILVLAVAAGTIGVWVVLRGLAFYSHAVGTAAFPGLVLADGLGFSAHLGAGLTAGVVALVVAALADDDDAVVALVLVGALVVGVVLASDVFESGANVDTLLFGSLLTIYWTDVVWSVGAAVAVCVAAVVLGARWTATGFDASAAAGLGVRSRVSDGVLLVLVALVAVVSLAAVGALLAAALIVVPALTARLLTDRMRPWRIASVVVAAAEGLGGLWLAFVLDAPPGATIAVLAAGVFAVVAVARWRRGRALLAGAAVSVVIAGCGGAGDGGDGKLQVVATTTQLGEVARAVGGRDADVHQILAPNTDPHAYEPRPSDAAAVAGADVVLVSGDGLDGWVGDLVAQSGGDPEVVDVGARVPHRLGGSAHGDEDDHGDHGSGVDPHWWHDPRNMEAAAGIVAAAYDRADGADVKAFTVNAKRYARAIARLDADTRACMRAVPARERKLVTDHDAFRYFTTRYGITVVGAVIPSQTTRAQPSARDVARLTDTIRRERVRAVFGEQGVNAKVARAVARSTGATVGEPLYGDSLGPKGSPGATYAGAERHNADALVRGFTGGARGCAT